MKYVVKVERKRNLVEVISNLGGEGVSKCIQCGSCMSVCPVTLVGFDYPNKKLFKFVQMGEEDPLLSDPSPWACVACGRCIEVCSQDVNPFSVYFALRRLQVRGFRIHLLAKEAVGSIYESGHAIFLDNSEEREKFGLPEVSSAAKSKKDLNEIREILRSSDISDLGILPR